jgi:hypothetical protein
LWRRPRPKLGCGAKGRRRRRRRKKMEIIQLHTPAALLFELEPPIPRNWRLDGTQSRSGPDSEQKKKKKTNVYVFQSECNLINSHFEVQQGNKRWQY